jgi:hypothetical protein
MTTAAVKRACDACHRRKVKCDGINPCRNCSSAQLSCTYNAIPQKKGPKGSRAKVISELRENQRQTSLSAKVQALMQGLAGASTSTTTTGLAPAPGLLSGDLVKACVHFFFDHMYPQMPILDRRTLEQQMPYLEQNPDAYCLVAALCAFVMLQPGMTMPAGDPFNLDMVPAANIPASQILLDEAIRVRRGCEDLDNVSFNALATNMFIFGCYYGHAMHEKAWYYLREASTMVHMVGMDKEEYLINLDPTDSSRRRRLYWLLFVLERAYGLQRQRPLTLQATINPPTLADDPADPLAHQLNPFIMLVNLYRSFDGPLVATWNKTRASLSDQYLTGLRKQLAGVVQAYACQDQTFADLRTCQQWLKNTTWQLTNGAVNGSGDDSLSFQYPNMSRDLLVSMAPAFGNNMDLVSSGLIEKLIEVVFSMTELMAIQPASRDPFTPGPRESLGQLLNIVAVSRTGDYRFLPLLLSKATELLPRLTNPMLQNAPESATMAGMDLFDGFGSAGVAQMPIEGDYERKFPVEDYEKKYAAMNMNGGTPGSVANSNNSTGGAQGSDMGGSFGGSPAMLSPGMEYPNAMNNFSMGEMVMNSMGSSGQQAPMNMSPGQQQQQQQQQAPMNMSPGQHQQGLSENMVQQHMNMNTQGMRTPSVGNLGMAAHAHQMHNMGAIRQPAQRQGSFHMPSHAGPMRVGDFQRMQQGRPNAQQPVPTQIDADFDFNTMR